MFVHNDPQFDDLLRIVASKERLAVGLVEKDYWVTHALWALQEQGFEAWLKGGTSLSKGFGLITRFSEDLDLKLEPGSVSGVESVANWKSTSKKAIQERADHFEQLAMAIAVPDAPVVLETDDDPTWRGARFRVQYPHRHAEDLGPMRPFVLLEVGSARVAPFVEVDMTSFVHTHLESDGRLAEFDENRPEAVRCVHPLLTLIEKLEAIDRRAMNEANEPADFARHYEDAARIIAAEADLPPIDGYSGIAELVDDMLSTRDIRSLPAPNVPALNPDESDRWDAIREGCAQIAPMFWGERVSVEDACDQIRMWLEGLHGARGVDPQEIPN